MRPGSLSVSHFLKVLGVVDVRALYRPVKFFYTKLGKPFVHGVFVKLKQDRAFSAGQYIIACFSIEMSLKWNQGATACVFNFNSSRPPEHKSLEMGVLTLCCHTHTQQRKCDIRWEVVMKWRKLTEVYTTFTHNDKLEVWLLQWLFLNG